MSEKKNFLNKETKCKICRVIFCIIWIATIILLVSKIDKIHQLELKLEEVKYEEVVLKPCYMCENEVELSPINDRFYIHCDSCGLETGYYKLRSNLVEQWNDRE